MDAHTFAMVKSYFKKQLQKSKKKRSEISNQGEWRIHFLNLFTPMVMGNTKINRTINKGCPQGEVLSPFQWNLLLDVLLQKFNNSDNIQAFADDLSLLSIGKTQYGIINITKKT